MNPPASLGWAPDPLPHIHPAAGLFSTSQPADDPGADDADPHQAMALPVGAVDPLEAFKSMKFAHSISPFVSRKPNVAVECLENVQEKLEHHE